MTRRLHAWLGLLPVAALFWLAWRLASGDWPVASAIDEQLGRLAFVYPDLAGTITLLLAVAAGVLVLHAWHGRPQASERIAGLLAAAAVVAWLGMDGVPWGIVWPGLFAVAALVVWRHEPSRRHDDENGWADSDPALNLADARAWLERRFEPITAARLGMALVLAGILLRIATYWAMDLRSDGQTYAAMAHGFAETGRFLMPYGELFDWRATPPAPSHHYPPAYPFALAMWYEAFGFGLAETKAFSITVSIAALGVAWWTTQDLYGRAVAWITTGLLAIEPQLLWSTGTNFSESMVLIFFALTMWGILKSLRWEPAILVAGGAAGLAYLTRSSVGIFFIVAGVGGFLWRFMAMRWTVFTNKWYLGAIVIFVTCVASWVGRNIRVFGGWPDWEAPWATSFTAPWAHVLDSGALAFIVGAVLLGAGVFWLGRPRDVPGAARMPVPAYSAVAVASCALAAWGIAWMAWQGHVHGSPPWHTSAYIQWAQEGALARPDLWTKALLYKAPFFALMFAPLAVFFLPELKASIKNIRAEEESGLWLGVVLLTVIAWIVASMFWVVEQSPMFWWDNRRYVVVAFLPMAWLLLRRVDWRLPRSRVRAAASAAVLLLFVFTVFNSPVQYPENDAAASLEGLVEPGDRIAYDIGMNKYSFYAYLPTTDVVVTGYMPGEPVDFIITGQLDKEYPGYEDIGRHTVKTWNGQLTVRVLQR